MEGRTRVIRFAVSLVVAGVIATQIPMNGGTALARDGYGGRGGSGTTGRTLIQATVGLAVGYGLISTVTSPTVPGGGGGGGLTPPPAGDNNDQNTTESIWDVANGRDDLNKFAQLADTAGEKDALQKKVANTPGMTAFIPNNAAFADLGDAKLQDLAKPENKSALANLLSYHIISGKYTIDQLKTEVKGLAAGKQYTTLAGSPVTIKLAGDVLTINDVRIIETDIPAANGIIHPIGQVLDPTKATTAAP
jgi:uncharacterized surface protein with fasciclin (FAS1) repeats